jgi:phosphopentomutase
MINRVILIVMDSVGVGHLPDADRFHGHGTNTLLDLLKGKGFFTVGVGELAHGISFKKDIRHG